MLHTEWSLVFFTTIAQWATGIMIAVLPFVFAKNSNGCTKLNRTALYFAAGLMVVALALSFLHLNNPLHSVYALSNLETSWLSREILFVSLFLFALVLVNFILYFKKPAVKYYRAFIPGTAIVGVIMVYTMSKLYMIPTVPPWNSPSTLVEFYSTALLIGSAFVLGLSLHPFHKAAKTTQKVGQGSKTNVLVFITFLAVGFLLINVLFLNHPTTEANVGFESEPVHPSFLVIRWGTILLGSVSVIFIIYKKHRLKNMSLVFYLPFVFFLISELIARAAFYASFYRIGV